MAVTNDSAPSSIRIGLRRRAALRDARVQYVMGHGFVAKSPLNLKAPPLSRPLSLFIRRATHRIKRASSSQAEDHTRDRLADVIETYRIKHLPKPEEDSPEKQVRKRRHSWPRSRANFSFS
jgi:hypothetical protein